MDAVRREVTGPARTLKLNFAQGRTSGLLTVLQYAIDSYGENPSFEKSIYYDAIVSPARHMKAFYRLAKIAESSGSRVVQVFPLRSSWIPSYMQIDTRILGLHILKLSNAQTNGFLISQIQKMKLWDRVVDLKQRIFRPQGGDLIFRGTIHTDGVGFTLTKQSQPTRARGSQRRKGEKFKEPYIEETKPNDLARKAVLIDTNRRDLLYCMHEDCTPEEKQLLRYTSSEHKVLTKSKKYAGIRNSPELSTGEIRDAERLLVGQKTTSLGNFTQYISTSSQVYWSLSNHYSQRIFRKLKLDAKFVNQKADAHLTNKLIKKFDTKILVMGDWGAQNSKYHEPIRGRGVRQMLRSKGFDVRLIDEYKSSKFCPTCAANVETFKRVKNPRPYKRATMPTVISHGLLRCTNQSCMEQPSGYTVVSKLWNRDLLACLNFRHILHNLRSSGARPDRFQRSSFASHLR